MCADPPPRQALPTSRVSGAFRRCDVVCRVGRGRLGFVHLFGEAVFGGADAEGKQRQKDEGDEGGSR